MIKSIFKKNRVFVVAEAGINHNGNFNVAKKMILAAKGAGADAIKFQAFKTSELIINKAPKAPHIKGKKSFFELLESFELKEKEYVELAKFARKQKIVLFASVFDLKSLEVLEKIGVPLYKVSSGDLDNHLLLRAIAKTKKPVIISTGMGNLEEIGRAVKIFGDRRGTNRNGLGILHCVSLYPPRADEFHLEKIGILERTFPKHIIGYSDHSLDILIPVSAVVLGARIIEKHLTLDKKMSGPDQQSSADPEEFKKMVEQIRYLEKAVNKKKSGFTMVPREQKMKIAFRRSLVSDVLIEKGIIITEKLLGVKRPGIGISPTQISKIVGKRAKRDLPKNTVIKLSDLI